MKINFRRWACVLLALLFLAGCTADAPVGPQASVDGSAASAPIPGGPDLPPGTTLKAIPADLTGARSTDRFHNDAVAAAVEGFCARPRFHYDLDTDSDCAIYLTEYREYHAAGDWDMERFAGQTASCYGDSLEDPDRPHTRTFVSTFGDGGLDCLFLHSTTDNRASGNPQETDTMLVKYPEGYTLPSAEDYAYPDYPGSFFFPSYSSSVNYDVLSQLDVVYFLLSAGQDYRAAGETEVAGGTAVRYDGRISLRDLGWLIPRVAVQLYKISFLLNHDDPGYEDLGFPADVPVSLWVDTASGLPLRVELDLGPVEQVFVGGAWWDLMNTSLRDAGIQGASYYAVMMEADDHPEDYVSVSRDLVRLDLRYDAEPPVSPVELPAESERVVLRYGWYPTERTFVTVRPETAPAPIGEGANAVPTGIRSQLDAWVLLMRESGADSLLRLDRDGTGWQLEQGGAGIWRLSAVKMEEICLFGAVEEEVGTYSPLTGGLLTEAEVPEGLAEAVAEAAKATQEGSFEFAGAAYRFQRVSKAEYRVWRSADLVWTGEDLGEDFAAMVRTAVEAGETGFVWEDGRYEAIPDPKGGPQTVCRLGKAGAPVTVTDLNVQFADPAAGDAGDLLLRAAAAVLAGEDSLRFTPSGGTEETFTVTSSAEGYTVLNSGGSVFAELAPYRIADSEKGTDILPLGLKQSLIEAVREMGESGVKQAEFEIPLPENAPAELLDPNSADQKASVKITYDPAGDCYQVTFPVWSEQLNYERAHPATGTSD